MSVPSGQHRVGKPLDEAAAQNRVAQITVLGNPETLRVLSAIAAGIPAAMAPDALHITAAAVADAVRSLSAAGLIRDTDTGWAPTGDAWVRFGRLLAADASDGAAAEDTPLTALPRAVVTIAEDLAYRFSSTFSRATVASYVAQSYLLLSQRTRVREHLLTMTARYAADRLEALASAQGLVLRDTPEVLFVCVQNAGRSQMAGAFLRHLAGGRVHVRTAGSSPADAAHPRVVEAMQELGVELWGEFPKPLTDEVVRAADFVVTMGCGDACPIFPGRRYMEWELPDPLELDDVGLRAVRDDIRTRVEELLDTLGVAPQDASL